MRAIHAHAGARHTMGAQTLPDMTPMVDVVMVILIFFMASTALGGSELLLRAKVATDRPTNAATPLIAPAALVIRLQHDPSGATAASGIGTTNITLESMIERIQSRAADLREAEIPVVIESESAVPYTSVVSVLAALERAGIRDVAIRAAR